MRKIPIVMFLDCTKRPITKGDELIVALNDMIYHGLQMDEADFPEYRHRRNEEVLIVECMCVNADFDEFLQVVAYKAKKNEMAILPDVMIQRPMNP